MGLSGHIWGKSGHVHINRLTPYEPFTPYLHEGMCAFNIFCSKSTLKNVYFHNQATKVGYLVPIAHTPKLNFAFLCPHFPVPFFEG
jgi:hypothetical protein